MKLSIHVHCRPCKRAEGIFTVPVSNKLRAEQTLGETMACPTCQTPLTIIKAEVHPDRAPPTPPVMPDA